MAVPGLGLPGTNSYVTALTVSGSNVYVGGAFTQAGGLTANRVALWNGSSWSTLSNGADNGVGSAVYDIAVSGSSVFVVGLFTTAGSISANHIAQWNGSTWSALGQGVDQFVSVLAVSSGNLYVGGQFTQADNSIYVGGDITRANLNTVATNYIALWDGSSWSALSVGTDGVVYALAMSGNTLYVGGNFVQAGGVVSNNIAQWDGAFWDTLDSGMDLSVYALLVSGTTLYAAGAFTTAGGFAANDVVQWNGAWAQTKGGVDATAYALALPSTTNTPYVGSAFSSAGGQVSAAVAKYIPDSLFDNGYE